MGSRESRVYKFQSRIFYYYVGGCIETLYNKALYGLNEGNLDDGTTPLEV